MGLSKIKTTLFILFFVSQFLQAGGGWTQKKGEGYFKLAEWWTLADKHYTTSGQIDPNTTIGLFNTNFYGEYGLNDRFTVIGFVPLFSRNLINNVVSSVNNEVLIKGDAINSVGDLDLTLKYGILKKTKWVLASSLTLGLPIGKTGGGIQNNLQTGDGEFNQMLRFDLSRGYSVSFLKAGSYLSLYGGGNNRTNNFSDEYRFGFETGFGWFKNKLWLIARLDGIGSFYNGETSGAVTSTSVFANNTEYLAYSVEAAAYFNKTMGVSASVSSLVYGRIIMAAPAFSIGVFMDLKRKEKAKKSK